MRTRALRSKTSNLQKKNQVLEGVWTRICFLQNNGSYPDSHLAEDTWFSFPDNGSPKVPGFKPRKESVSRETPLKTQRKAMEKWALVTEILSDIVWQGHASSWVQRGHTWILIHSCDTNTPKRGCPHGRRLTVATGGQPERWYCPVTTVSS